MDRGRYGRVVRLFTRFGLELWWLDAGRRLRSAGRQRRLEHRTYARQARRFREVAEGLGGLIIKLGQYLSVRVDMLPREYTEELSALQDSVPPVPFEDIADVFEKSVGATVGEAFATFEREPLAAASLGQVHEATLVSGQRVAVKILRPHIAETIETDLAALKTIFGMAQRYTRLGDTIDFDQLYGEFERTVSAELDLMREGRSAEAVREKLHDFPNVAVPDIHWGTSSSEVLTMEYMEGVSISDIGALDAMGIDRAQLATDLIDVFAEMILYDGLFHADPHPGNVHVQADGTIVLLDFGMMGTITDDMRKGFMGVVTAIFSRDAASLVDRLGDLGFIRPGTDTEGFTKAVLALLGHLDVGDPDKAISTLENYSDELRDFMYEQPFQLPANVAFLGKAVATVAGICQRLNPDIDLVSELTPLAQDLVGGEGRADGPSGLLSQLKDIGEAVIPALGQLPGLIERASSGRLVVRLSRTQVSALTDGQRSGTDRMTRAILGAALFVPGALCGMAVGWSPLAVALFVMGLVLMVYQACPARRKGARGRRGHSSWLRRSDA